MDYESELQPCFSPPEDDISEPGKSPRTPVPGQADSSTPDYKLGAGAAEYAPMAGHKRRPNSPEDAQRCKAPKELSACPPGTAPVGSKPIPVDLSACPPGTAPVGSKPIPVDLSACPPGTAPVGSKPISVDLLAYPPGTARVGRKPISSDILANLPGTAPEGSKPIPIDAVANLPGTAPEGNKSIHEPDGGGL